MCFFRGDFNGTPPQRRSHTHTHTHTHDGPTVDAGSSGSRFFGFLQFKFRPSEVSNFLDRQGVTQYTKILSSESNYFFLFMFIFFNAGSMLQMYSIIRI